MAMASFDGNKLSGLKEKVKQLKYIYDKKGLPELASQLKTMLNKWKDVHIKIAVAGRAGAGKSSFINAIRNITADDIKHNPAKVDVKECTNNVQEYIYPNNNNFRIYDLPGLGTPRFQQSTYLADVTFEQYDFVIILTDTRFTNEDEWLAQQTEEKGKPFYFVRSKIDNDIKNDKRAHPRSHNTASMLNRVKEDLESNLKRFSRKDVFLIDNYKTELYEFGRLTSKLIHDSDEIIQDALAFSLACLSNEVIEEKKEILQRRIPLICFVVAVAPYPIGAAFKSEEVKFYNKQFQVDATSLTAGVEACDLSEDERETFDGKKSSPRKNMSVRSLLPELEFINFVPVLGHFDEVVNCEIYLTKCLDETAVRAKETHGLMIEGLARKCTSSLK